MCFLAAAIQAVERLVKQNFTGQNHVGTTGGAGLQNTITRIPFIKWSLKTLYRLAKNVDKLSNGLG